MKQSATTTRMAYDRSTKRGSELFMQDPRLTRFWHHETPIARSRCCRIRHARTALIMIMGHPM
jgi:hypothetical protein